MAKTKKILTLLINNKMVIKSKKDYSMNLLFYLKSGGKTDRQDRHREISWPQPWYQGQPYQG